MKKYILAGLILSLILFPLQSYAALSAVKTFSDGYVLTASDLNNLNNNILNNANSLFSPFTGNVDAASYNISDVGTLTATTGTITTGTITDLTATTGTITTLTATTGTVTGLTATTGTVTNLTSTKAYIDYVAPIGYIGKNVGIIGYKDADEIYIYSNVVDCDGKLCYWSSTLEFTEGSGGSNNSSDDLTQAWHYIFIDYSTVTSGTILTNANFRNDSTAPTYDQAKQGWYTGSDRCIGAILGDATPDILKFIWSDNLYVFDDVSAALSTDPGDTNWHDLDLSSYIPALGNVVAYLKTNHTSANYKMYYRTNGFSETTYVITAQQHEDPRYAHDHFNIMTDTSQVIEWAAEHADLSNLIVAVLGFYISF